MRDPKLRLPRIAEIVRGALAVREASLVIYRSRLLVEMKTDRLGEGLSLYEEDGHRSWQIGAFDDHHCHLDIGLVSRVSFEAEKVSCQGGRLNYTVWFLLDEDCGNPYRKDAYFSVVLNKPYAEDGGLRRELVEQMFDLYRRVEREEGVSASPVFLGEMSRIAMAA